MIGDVLPPYTARLIEKLADALAEVPGSPPHPGDLARALLKRDVWLIDRTRRMHLVDDLVYESALTRAHRFEAELEVWTGQLHPSPETWALLPKD